MRSIILLAAAMLAAAPAAAQQQSATAQNDPTVEIDPCTGKPVVTRPDAEGGDAAGAQANGAHAPAGAQAGAAPASSASQAAGAQPASGAAHGTAAGSTVAGSVASSTSASGSATSRPGNPGTAASSTAASGSATSPSANPGAAAASASASGQTTASSTSASGSTLSPSANPGAAAASASASGQTTASSTSAGGSTLSPSANPGAAAASASTSGQTAAASPSVNPGTAASSTSGSGQTTASATSASGSAISPNTNPGAAASATSGAGQTMASSTSARADGRPTDPRAAARNRAALRLGLGPAGDRVRLGPAASVSIPTALGVDAGEMFFGVAYQGRTRYTEEDDAAAVFGIGIGSRRMLALEAAVTTYSTFRGAPFETGGVSVKLHRALPGQTSAAVGWENAILWGDSDDEGSLYAVASRLVNLRDDPSAPFSTGVVTLGVGNGRFRLEEDDAEGRETVNVFGAVGVRVIAPLSVVADWTGQDLNAAASITPVPRLPLVITAGLADLTGSAGDGARLIFSLGYGLAFPQPF